MKDRTTRPHLLFETKQFRFILTKVAPACVTIEQREKDAMDGPRWSYWEAVELTDSNDGSEEIQALRSLLFAIAGPVEQEILKARQAESAAPDPIVEDIGHEPPPMSLGVNQ